MSEAAIKDKVRLHVIWAFRDPALQREQFEEAKRKHGPRNGIRWLAPPGFSEHQTDGCWTSATWMTRKRMTTRFLSAPRRSGG